MSANITAARAPAKHANAVDRAQLNRVLAIVAAPPFPSTSNHAGTAPLGASVIAVLGMHRSGLGVLSEVLHCLGADMIGGGDAATRHSADGAWTRPEIAALHEEVLDIVGRPFGDPLHSLPFPAGWWRDRNVLAIKQRMQEYLKNELVQAHGPWGFADTTTCRLLPLWQDLFAGLSIQPHYILAVRSPAEIAASLSSTSPEFRWQGAAEVCWLAYIYDLLRYTQESVVTPVWFNEWFSDPVAVARRLMERLQLPGLPAGQALADRVTRIIDRTRRNHVEGEGAALATIPFVQSLFQELAGLDRDSKAEDRNLAGFIAVLDIVFRIAEPFAQVSTDLTQESLASRVILRGLTAEHKEMSDSWDLLEWKLASCRSQITQIKAASDEQSRNHLSRIAELAAEREEFRARVDAQQDELIELRSAAKTLRSDLDEAKNRHLSLAAAERDRLARLESYAEALLSEKLANQNAVERRIVALQTTLTETERTAAASIAALQAKFEESEARCRELQIACDGYLARIEALKQQKKAWR